MADGIAEKALSWKAALCETVFGRLGTTISLDKGRTRGLLRGMNISKTLEHTENPRNEAEHGGGGCGWKAVCSL